MFYVDSCEWYEIRNENATAIGDTFRMSKEQLTREQTKTQQTVVLALKVLSHCQFSLKQSMVCMKN